MAVLNRPALRYFGGKWRLAAWILSYFPEHDCYVEPFGGAGSVLLRKAPAVVEVYNDIDSRLVTFFRVLRERPRELVRAIRLTPFSRVEYARALESCEDELEQARRVYVYCWQGMGRGVLDYGGWRFVRNMAKRCPTLVQDWGNIRYLFAVAERLKNVQLECQHAVKVLRRWDWPGALFYLDPPYLADTRCQTWAKKAYLYELTEEQHIELAGVLHELQGKVVLSGYASELYEDLYRDWRCVSKLRSQSQGRGGKQRVVRECLWMNW